MEENIAARIRRQAPCACPKGDPGPPGPPGIYINRNCLESHFACDKHPIDFLVVGNTRNAYLIEDYIGHKCNWWGCRLYSSEQIFVIFGILPQFDQFSKSELLKTCGFVFLPTFRTPSFMPKWVVISRVPFSLDFFELLWLKILSL